MTDAALALHESAHAAVAVACGRRVLRMALGEDGGTCWVAPPGHRNDGKARRELIVVLLAGAAATRMLTPPDGDGGWRL